MMRIRLLAAIICAVPAFADLGAYTASVRNTSGIVAYYRLDEASGNFLDTVGGNTATASGGLTYSATGGLTGGGDSDPAVTFNGSTGVGSITNQTPFNFEYNLPFTIEALVKPNISGTAEYSILGKTNAASPFRGWAFELKGNGSGSVSYIEFWFINTFSSSYRNLVSAAVVPNGAWSHVAATYDGSSILTLYVNGVAVASSATGVSATIQNSTPALIGARPSIQFFNGGLDEIAVYNRSVTQDELAIHYGLSVAAEPQFNAGSPLNLILDDDSSTDRDNLYDAYFLLHLARLGYINMLGFIDGQSSTVGPACMQQTLIYSGRASTPVGAYQGGDADTTDTAACASSVLATLNPSYAVRSAYTSSAVEYRALLTAAANGSVTIIMGGPATNLYTFFQDGLSPAPLTLFAAKVAAVYWVAGVWPSGTGDFNFSAYTPYAPDASSVLASWPSSVPIQFVGIDQGTPIVVGTQTASFLQTNNPQTLTFVHGGGTRSAWVQIAVIHAIFDPSGGWFSAGGANGTAAVISLTGANAWASTPNTNMGYEAKVFPDARYQWFAETFMYRELHPFQATWATGMQ